MFTKIARRGLLGVAALGLVVSLGACDTLLEVDNYGAVDEKDINDPELIPEMVYAVRNEFQKDFAYMVYAGAIFTDEAVNGHNYDQWKDIDLRIIEDNNTQIRELYRIAQSARGTGDDMTERLRELVDDPSTSLELATALTYAGYSYIQLGEFFCYAPIQQDGEGKAVRSDDILTVAIDYFEEAISILEGQSGSDAERILNLARVGAARASLQKGEFTDAIAFASPVPANFVVWVNHAENPTSRRNHLSSATKGANQSIGVDAPFRDLNDRRIRHAAESVRGHNGETDLWTPYQSSSYSEWTADGESQPIENTTGIRLASGLEARYIVAEAGGMSNAELLDFINERRAVGGQGDYTGTDLQAELRDQRRRDFFLDGHRLGDLRRYLALYNIDEFPTGAHPTDGWGNYGTATCLIPHREEGEGNPNYEPLD